VATGSAANAQSGGVDDVALLAEIRAHDHVYFRSVRDGEFGRVVVADLRATDTRRVRTPLTCDRVDFGVTRGICLSGTRGAAGPSATATIIDRDFHVVGAVTLPGIPIRARLSPDERRAVATVFVTGERYDADFTTRTELIDAEHGTAIDDLERFTTMRDGRPFSRVDFNFWGVTFARDSQRFVATLGFTGTRLLVSGDIEGRQLQVVRANVECPSLSPDQRHIAFKARVPGADGWRIHVMNVDGSGEFEIAGEPRSIDDQIEWLDDEHVLYQFIADRGLPDQAVNVWQVAAVADDRSASSIFIHGGHSPAVVRPF
jgi:hypothetical protein